MKEWKQKIDGIEWTYQIKELPNKKVGFKVIFLNPTKLVRTSFASSLAKEYFDKHKKVPDSQIENMLNSAITDKYKEKLEDSFRTKLKIFLFSKAFEIKIHEYLKKNKEEIKDDFCKFKLTKTIADIYSSKYYQYDENIEIEYNKKIKTGSELYNNLKNEKEKYLLSSANLKTRILIYQELKKIYIAKAPISIEEFRTLITENTCAYCGITLDQIYKLGENTLLHNKRSETRGYSLEIDRKCPNLEYTKGNCCMSCYWCNNAKTDEFLPSEFIEVARGINIVWQCRGKEAKISNWHVDFPKDSKVWTDDCTHNDKQSECNKEE